MNVAISYKKGNSRKEGQCLYGILQNLDCKKCHQITRSYTYFPIIILKTLIFQVLSETHPETYVAQFHMVQIPLPKNKPQTHQQNTLPEKFWQKIKHCQLRDVCACFVWAVFWVSAAWWSCTLIKEGHSDVCTLLELVLLCKHNELIQLHRQEQACQVPLPANSGTDHWAECEMASLRRGNCPIP